MTPLEKVKASKLKCKRHRDNWKRKAKSYENIIRRVFYYHGQRPGLCVECKILKEADFWATK